MHIRTHHIFNTLIQIKMDKIYIKDLVKRLSISRSTVYKHIKHLGIVTKKD